MKWMMIVLLAGCGTAPTRRDTLDSIPSAAAAALKRAAGGAQIEHVERDGDVYEASWHVNGLEHEAAVTAGGELVGMEEEVPSSRVPSRVRAAAIAKLVNAQQIKFVKLMSGNYEAEAVVDGREQEATFAPDGREVADDDGARDREKPDN